MVNNAGGASALARIDKELIENHEKWMRVNVTGVWNGIRSAIPAMKANGGSIVDIWSINGVQGVSGMATYSATQFAVVGLTKSTALELGQVSILSQYQSVRSGGPSSSHRGSC